MSETLKNAVIPFAPTGVWGRGRQADVPFTLPVYSGFARIRNAWTAAKVLQQRRVMKEYSENVPQQAYNLKGKSGRKK